MFLPFEKKREIEELIVIKLSKLGKFRMYPATRRRFFFNMKSKSGILYSEITQMLNDILFQCPAIICGATKPVNDLTPRLNNLDNKPPQNNNQSSYLVFFTKSLKHNPSEMLVRISYLISLRYLTDFKHSQ